MLLGSRVQGCDAAPRSPGGASFNPDEFAIVVEQGVACTAPKDYNRD